MENRKSVLITIVVLLLIFTPLSIIGILNTNNIGIMEENPNHEIYYERKIYFYDSEDKFLSYYECQTEVCDFASSLIDDNTYGINYYKDGAVTKAPIVDEKYTFINDGSAIYLYATNTGSNLQTYKAIKYYNTSIENNIYIVQNSNNVWGVLSIGSTLRSVLPFQYDFIGLINNLNEDGSLKADNFIVLKDNKWSIVNSAGSTITGLIDDPIIDYTNEYIISKNQDKVRIYSYENYEYLTDYNIKDYVILDNYIGIITDTFVLVYENLGVNYLGSYTLTDNSSEVDLEKTDTKIDIKVNGNVVETIELT